MSVDLLDRVQVAATDLLSRVDAALDTYGVPADHPVWSQSRRVGATPGAAVAHFERLDATRLRDVASRLRTADVSGVIDDVPRTTWAGAGAAAYVARREALGGFINDVAGGWRATAEHLEAVADWVDASRSTIARGLATCIGSREAVLIRTGDESQIAHAAASLAEHVLRVVAGCVDDAWDVYADWQGTLGETEPTAGTAQQDVGSGRIELR